MDGFVALQIVCTYRLLDSKSWLKTNPHDLEKLEPIVRLGTSDDAYVCAHHGYGYGYGYGYARWRANVRDHVNGHVFLA